MIKLTLKMQMCFEHNTYIFVLQDFGWFKRSLVLSVQGGHCPVPSMEEALAPEDDPPVLPKTIDAAGGTSSGEQVMPQTLEAEQTSALRTLPTSRTSRTSLEPLPAFQEVFMQMQVLLPLNKQLLIVPPTVLKKDDLHFFSVCCRRFT